MYQLRVPTEAVRPAPLPRGSTLKPTVRNVGSLIMARVARIKAGAS